MSLLGVRDLCKTYPMPGIAGALGRRSPPALDRASLTVRPGEVVGLVGESGSGKTTLARAALGLLPFDEGEVTLLGRPLARPGGRVPRRFRRRCQLLIQNPDASLNPGLTVRQHLGESARLHRPLDPPEDVVIEIAARVGLSFRLDGLPHELSGGEKRRVGIARILVADPDLTVADEPTSGLDAALRAGVIELLLARRTQDRGYLLISHDLPLAAWACDRLVVMYAGRVIEEVPVSVLGREPHHPYTALLLAAAGMARDGPPVRPDRPAGRGSAGCPFHGPCPLGRPSCAEVRPELAGTADHQIACLVVNA
ncbi:MAG: ABC transporter ATP-binding protein [Deltaproteobacteria bacterium]|nr:ABC transporter ATP-binding protein [Deltaproteobacteria bacterium]